MPACAYDLLDGPSRASFHRIKGPSKKMTLERARKMTLAIASRLEAIVIRLEAGRWLAVVRASIFGSKAHLGDRRTTGLGPLAEWMRVQRTTPDSTWRARSFGRVRGLERMKNRILI